MKNQLCERENCFVCKHISADWLVLFREKRSVINYKKGSYLFHEGDPVKGVFVIISGKVKVDTLWGNKPHILRLASDGDLVGHRGFGLQEVYPINAVALEPTTVCFIESQFFKTLLRTNFELLWRLNFFYAEELQRTEQKMKTLANTPVKERVAMALLEIRDKFGMDKDGLLGFRMTRKDMAAMTGSTYETVIRMLNELVSEGLIEVRGKDVKLINLPKLERMQGKGFTSV